MSLVSKDIQRNKVSAAKLLLANVGQGTAKPPGSQGSLVHIVGPEAWRSASLLSVTSFARQPLALARPRLQYPGHSVFLPRLVFDRFEPMYLRLQLSSMIRLYFWKKSHRPLTDDALSGDTTREGCQLRNHALNRCYRFWLQCISCHTGAEKVLSTDMTK